MKATDGYSVQLLLALFLASCVFITAAWPDETIFYRAMTIGLQMVALISVAFLIFNAARGS